MSSSRIPCASPRACVRRASRHSPHAHRPARRASPPETKSRDLERVWSESARADLVCVLCSQKGHFSESSLIGVAKSPFRVPTVQTMMLAFAALAFSLPRLTLAFSLTSRTPRSIGTPFATRVPLAPVAFLEPEHNLDLDNIESSSVKTWLRTPNSGLKYKELKVVRDSAVPVAGDIVELAYTATLLSTGRVVEQTVEGRSLKFIFGQNDSLPFFEETLVGMSAGGKRRVLLSVSPFPFSSGKERDDTLQFDVELKSITTGKEAIAFRVTRALPGLIRTAVLLSFLPDVLNFLGLFPHGALTFAQPGFGAVDLVSTPSDAPAIAQAVAAPMVDAANRWAAEGLRSLF